MASMQPRTSPCEIEARFQDGKIDRLLYNTIYFMNSGCKNGCNNTTVLVMGKFDLRVGFRFYTRAGYKTETLQSAVSQAPTGGGRLSCSEDFRDEVALMIFVAKFRNFRRKIESEQRSVVDLPSRWRGGQLPRKGSTSSCCSEHLPQKCAVLFAQSLDAAILHASNVFFEKLEKRF